MYIYIYIYQDSMLRDLLCRHDIKMNVHMKWGPKHNSNIFSKSKGTSVTHNN